MTSEKALNILQTCKERGFKTTFFTLSEYYKALDIAIKALEQEPKLLQALEQEKGAYNALVKDIQCADCISRQAVLDMMQMRIGGKELYKAVYDLPPVNPQGPKTGWIPVSERLPNDDEDVLVCYSQGGMDVCYYHIDDTFYPTEYADLNETGWFNENGDALYFEPIAWMPLPEPYKAETEGT